MLRPRLVPSIAGVALLAISFDDARALDDCRIISGVNCDDQSHAIVSWNAPTVGEDWFGYDVFRRPAGSCGPYERITPAMVPLEGPRVYTDTPPGATTFEYRVFPVDPNREIVTTCEARTWTWTTCPPLSAPIITAMIEDLGPSPPFPHFYVAVPCPEECWPVEYWHGFGGSLEEVPYPGNVLRLYGYFEYGTIEGNLIYIDRWEPGRCGATPAGRASWGQVKAIYR
jgi:hypothetical protein